MGSSPTSGMFVFWAPKSSGESRATNASNASKLFTSAVIAQLVARRSHNPKVVSSILTHRILTMLAFLALVARC